MSDTLESEQYSLSPPPFPYAVVLDFEATCDQREPPRPQEVIEFPSVLMEMESGDILDEFSSFVRPTHHPELSDFCTELTSIVQSDVAGAEPFFEVFQRHQEWLGSHGLDENNALFVTCGDWDFGTLFPAQCAVSDPPVQWIPPMYRRWHNIKTSFATHTGLRKAPGMAAMLPYLNLELEGRHHRGIDDCRNIARILQAINIPGFRLDVTGEISASRYPPLDLRLQLGDESADVVLRKRKIGTLTGLAQTAFRRNVVELRLVGGRRLDEDAQLLELTPGAAVAVSVS